MLGSPIPDAIPDPAASIGDFIKGAFTVLAELGKKGAETAAEVAKGVTQGVGGVVQQGHNSIEFQHTIQREFQQSV